MTLLITKAELSRIGKVSKAAVTKITNAALSDAVVNGKIDAEHPLIVEWLSGKNVYSLPPEIVNKALTRQSSKLPVQVQEPEQEPEPEPTIVGGYDIKDLDHYTLRELVMRFGSIDGFKRYVESLKLVSDIKHRDIKIQTIRGELINRDAVKGMLLPLIDVAFQRLVTDVPAAITQQIVARIESGGDETIADVEQIIRDANSKVLKNAKTQINKTDILNDNG